MLTIYNSSVIIKTTKGKEKPERTGWRLSWLVRKTQYEMLRVKNKS
jgi:hypothetical protein